MFVDCSFSITLHTTSKFDNATITFVIDKSKIGSVKFEDIMFLWYDEENNNYVELDTTLDEAASTASITTKHFSKYMVVDRKAWFENWRNIYNIFEKLNANNPSITAICVDCSGSMSSNDPSFSDDDGTSTCYRNLAVTNYIDAMFDSDKTSIITFEDTAKEVYPLSSSKSILKSFARFYNGGGTNADSAVEIALNELENKSGNKSIILLSDGDVNVNSNRINYAAQKGILIHTVGLGSGANNTTLKRYSDVTGGEHFTATTANNLKSIYNSISESNQLHFDSMSDSDGDGVPDDIEISGIPLPNGKLVFTDPNNKHSDRNDEFPIGDGLTDGEEVGKMVRTIPESCTSDPRVPYKFTFNVKSDPTKIDSDNDGTDDKTELTNNTNPNVHKCEEYISKVRLLEKEVIRVQNDVLRWRSEYQTSLITMNIIRATNPSYYNADIIHELMWGATAGEPFEDISSEIAHDNSELLNYFKFTEFVDYDNMPIDFVHMMATLSGYEWKSSDKELAGWAGDLQSFIYDVKVNTYGYDNYNPNVINDLIGTSESKYFGDLDMRADIDAHNIYHMYSTSINLSSMLSKYYRNNANSRNRIFVNTYGDINELTKVVDSYSRGNGVIKHYLLKKHSKEAAKVERVKNAYENSIVDYIQNPCIDQFGNIYIVNIPVHSLPDPATVTNEESNLLRDSFVNYIRMGL